MYKDCSSSGGGTNSCIAAPKEVPYLDRIFGIVGNICDTLYYTRGKLESLSGNRQDVCCDKEAEKTPCPSNATEELIGRLYEMDRVAREIRELTTKITGE